MLFHKPTTVFSHRTPAWYTKVPEGHTQTATGRDKDENKPCNKVQSKSKPACASLPHPVENLWTSNCCAPEFLEQELSSAD